MYFRSEPDSSIYLILGRPTESSSWFQIIQSKRSINFISTLILSKLSQIAVLEISPKEIIKLHRSYVKFSGSCDIIEKKTESYNLQPTQQQRQTGETIMNNLIHKNISWIDVTPIFDAAMGPDNVTLLKINWNIIDNSDSSHENHSFKLHWNCNDTEQGIIYTNQTQVFVKCQNNLFIHILSPSDDLLIDPVIWQISDPDKFWSQGSGGGSGNLPATGIPATVSLALVLTALVVSMIMLIILLRLYSNSDHDKRPRKPPGIQGQDSTLESGISIMDSTHSAPLSFERFVLNHRLMNFNVDMNNSRSTICRSID